MENAGEEINPGYRYLGDSGVIQMMRDSSGEEIVRTVDFNQTAISKLLDAADRLTKIQQTQKRIADILDLTEEDESETDVDGTVTFPLKSLKEFQSLERMSNNEAYRKNLTKSLRLLLINGPIQDPIKNLLDDSIVMHFAWDDLEKPYLISLRQTICFGHVIYNALGMGFADYANFVQTCLSLAQARSQNQEVTAPTTIQAETQFQNFTFVVSDISQRISDIEIFQKKIESYTCFKKHEIDPKVYFPINSFASLEMLENVLQYKVIQEIVVTHCKELYGRDQSLQSIVSSDFLAEFSLVGQRKKSDLFKFTFFNHSLFVALEMSRQDYEVEITHQIDCAGEKISGWSSQSTAQENPDPEAEAMERANKILTHRKILMIRKDDLTEQGIPKKFRNILRNRTSDKATIFTDSKNFISFAKVDPSNREVDKDLLVENLEEKVARYFPIKSYKTFRQINIKLTDVPFQFSMQCLLDDFYYNRKFSVKDIISDDFLAIVEETDLFDCFLFRDFLPLILSLPRISFFRMVKQEFRALKIASELRRVNQDEFIRVKMEVGQTVDMPKSANGTFKQYFPITGIGEFDDLERNLEYPDFYKEVSNHCKIILMKEKKFKLKNFLAEHILTKYSVRGSNNTLSLMDTKLFGEILKQFSKLSQADFMSVLQKHHSIGVNKMRNSNIVSDVSQDTSSLERRPEQGCKRKRQFVEIVFPLANHEQLAVVNENLQEDGFRAEIENVLRDLIYPEDTTNVEEIHLDDILEEDLISKLTWDENETTSLKNYSLFTATLFRLMNVEWIVFENIVQKAMKRISEPEKINPDKGERSSNDFVIISPTKKMRHSENPIDMTSQESILLEPPPSTSLVSQNSVEPPKAPSVPDDDDSQDVVYDTDDDSSNINGFEQILPIKSIEEFHHMETLLTDKHFLTYFSLLCANSQDRASLLTNIITENALRYFSWSGSAETLCFQDTILCNILAAKAYCSNVDLLKNIIDSVQEKAAAQEPSVLFPITNKNELKTVESYLPHIKHKMVAHFSEIRENAGNEAFNQMFSSEMINNTNVFELENLPRSPFYKEVIQVVFKDLRRHQVLSAIRDELESPDGFFKRILPVNEINLGIFEQKLKKKDFVECLIKICTAFVEMNSDGYFHKLIDSDLIQQYSFSGEDGLRSIEKSLLYNCVLKEVYKKSDVELQAKVQMELYLAQALADYKSDKLQS